MNPIVKKSIPHVIAIAIFLILTCIYFAPGIFEGKTLQQGDMQKVSGMAQELYDYYQKEGGKSAWTGSMFSGMPAYHIQIHGNSPNYLSYLEKPVKTIDYGGASMILTALICFYILMCVMGVKRWLAIAGAIAFAFASYNLIIITAGHITKMYVMAYMPLTLAGMILLFRKNLLWGGILSLLGISFSLMNSHIQITYYLTLFCIIFFIGLTINAFLKKETSLWIKSTVILIAAVAISLFPSLAGLYADYEVGQESLRGPSELTTVKDGVEEKPSTGLDIDYAFNWSYGRGELLTLLIPNAYGGASVETLGKDSEFYKTYRRLGGQVGKEVQAPAYWGTQLFTSGPVYFGAIVCFLFVIGMFVIKSPLKWWIAGASLLFIIMSLGKNFSSINDFLFYHLPMYSKFRTPSMALVIPGLTFPLIGFWGLKRIVGEKVDAKQLKKSLIWALSITGGICLLIWMIPGTFLSFESAHDAQQIPEQLIGALIDDRKSMASSDAFRSLIFILLAGGLIFFFLQMKNKKTGATVLGVGLLVLITIDLWTVDKRYLNDKSYSKQQVHETYPKTPADEFILQDTSPSYRVLNLTEDPFQGTNTSYFHKSIGGYHAAKLRRYQELINHRIMGEINTIYATFQAAKSVDSLHLIFLKTPTLNMLNTKYLIYQPEQPPLVNPYADGNAWFVDEVKFAANANQEIDALNTINPLKTAVIDEKFAGQVLKNIPPNDSISSIKLLEYKPNILKYESNTPTEKIAVFSEIYYDHGWKVFVDGKQTDYYRADWTLRAMNVPAGNHTIEFRFEPDTYFRLNMIGSISSLIVLLGFIGVLIYSGYRLIRRA
ncbi:membrane protein [Bacteroidia bacterium]|nr:membrane protein [Bacteroidia bacterium]